MFPHRRRIVNRAGRVARASLLAVVIAAGCATGESVQTPGGGGTAGAAGSAGSAGGANATGAAGAGAGNGTAGAGDGGARGGTTGSITGGAGAGGAPALTQPLPFAADAYYAPSGFMGDGGASTSAIVMLPKSDGDPRDCGGDRAPIATPIGDCHIVSYQPVAPPVGQGWGGVFWQYPLDNWGDRPGLAIAPGAQRVSFWARGAVGGEKVTFLAGGEKGMGKPYQDTLAVTRSEVLTSAWQMYSIDLAGQSYNPTTGVLGGFGWTVDAADVTAGTINFRIDGIQWQ